ncbi:MAG: hypothetical protein ABEK12_02180, partial [Candidatus Nanohaloarchaea archaeon]
IVGEDPAAGSGGDTAAVTDATTVHAVIDFGRIGRAVVGEYPAATPNRTRPRLPNRPPRRTGTGGTARTRTTRLPVLPDRASGPDAVIRRRPADTDREVRRRRSTRR